MEAGIQKFTALNIGEEGLSRGRTPTTDKEPGSEASSVSTELSAGEGHTLEERKYSKGRKRSHRRIEEKREFKVRQYKPKKKKEEERHGY